MHFRPSHWPRRSFMANTRLVLLKKTNIGQSKIIPRVFLNKQWRESGK